MKSWAAVLAPALLSSAAAVSFVAPFDTKGDFELSGDASVVGSVVQLAGAPQQRGAVWMKTPVATEEWTLEAVLRSNPDMRTDIGKSGFTVWYTAKPNALGPVHGGSDKWDGLAVMMDGVGTSQAVRGHLNDGSYQFGGSVEADALSLCRVNYRNAAGPLTVRIGYSHEGFVVDINGQKCFMTTEVSLPPGYFGVSANSDVSNDVLSVERLDVSAGMKQSVAAHLPQHASDTKPAEAQQQQQQQPAAAARGSGSESAATNYVVDTEGVKAALGPVQSRLELVDQKLARLDSVVNQLVDTLTLSLAQVSGSQSGGSGSEETAVQKELSLIRSQISEVRKSVFQEQPAAAQVASGPGIWKIVAVVMGTQVVGLTLFTSLRGRRHRHEKLI